MKTSVFEKLTKDGQSIILSSPTVTDNEALLSFIAELQSENPGQRTLVAEYPRNLDELNIVLKEVLSSSNDLILIAKLNDSIVGLVDFYDSTIETDPYPVAEIGVSVLSKFQGRGIATVLMRTCIDIAKKHSIIKMIMLTVTTDKPNAKNLYTKLGFVETALEEVDTKTKHWMELHLL